MSEEQVTMAEVLRRLEEQDRKYEARTRIDDERDQRAERDRREMLDRVDGHGQRMTGMETKWAAFFGEQGAFRIFTAQLTEQAKKTDRLTWLVAVGVGIVITLQFVLKR
jgi:hypothetical protein